MRSMLRARTVTSCDCGDAGAQGRRLRSGLARTLRAARLQTELQTGGLDVADSYVSLTEVSEYAAGCREMKQARLTRRSTRRKPAMCFYPMSKRRAPGPRLVCAELETGWSS